MCVPNFDFQVGAGHSDRGAGTPPLATVRVQSSDPAPSGEAAETAELVRAVF